MRISYSHHTESIQTKAAHIWPRHNDASFRPALNFQALYQLLQTELSKVRDASETSSSSEQGKKRSSNRIPTRSSKRLKLSRESSGDGSEHNTQSGLELDDFNWPNLDYPELPQRTRLQSSPDETQSVPVLRHTYEMRYTNQPVLTPASGTNKCKLWSSEEENFAKVLAELQTTETRTIELGDVEIVEYCDRLVVVSPMLTNVQWSLLLPLHTEGLDLEWFGIACPLVQDVMMAVHILKVVGRTHVQALLKMVISPARLSDVEQQDELPFQLLIETTVSFQLPAIFERFPRPNKRANTLYLEDAQRRLLQFLFPSDPATPGSPGGPINISFFHSILPAAPPLHASMKPEALQPERLLPTLLPFQRRSLAWLLDREGKIVLPDGQVEPKAPSIPFSFWDRIEEGNHIWYINRLSGHLSPLPPDIEPALGAILAEEPGLGKTLESIALILMNPAPETRPSVMSEAQIELEPIKSTLIVTPPALASQWVDELAAHAPSLKVLIYEGWFKAWEKIDAERLGLSKKKSKPKQRSKKGKLNKQRNDDDSSDDDMDVDFDVVITTYTVLRKDFHVAHSSYLQLRHSNGTHRMAKSLLVIVEWHRVIMDEVQMVGGGQTEDMVSLIPRVSSLAVSGTPARRQTADLMHLLKFLRIDNVVETTRLWKRLISTDFGAAHFAALFQAYGIRTIKANVKDELTIPKQTRYLVNITLGPVEKHVYDQALEAVLQELGLDARGVAASDGWQIDSTALRSALRRLRGICTHPQVGQLQKTGDKFFKPGAVKTMSDVLQNMKETNRKTMMENQKAKVQALIRIAQLQARDENDDKRYLHALTSLVEAEKDALALVDEARTALDKHRQKKRQNRPGNSVPEEADAQHLDKGKGRQESEKPSDEELSENEGESGLGDHDGKKQGAIQNRLRECRIVLHRAKFLQGDIHHALGTDYSAAEDAAYSAAENVRRELLKGTEEDTLRITELLTQDATRQHITRDILLIDVPLLDISEFLLLLESYQPTQAELKAKHKPTKVGHHKRVQFAINLTEEAERIIEVLNKQSALLWEWRSHLTTLLTQKVASSDDQPDGEEYQRTLDNQGDAEMYLQSYTALLSDRRQALLNERTLLAAHAVQEKKHRHTKAAMNALSAAQLTPIPTPEEIEIQPEHQVLYSELSHNRQDLLNDLNGRAIKSVIVELQTAAAGLKQDNDPEKVALKEAVLRLRELTSNQIALMDKLDADLALIRKAFNQRILYFRQLQEISDTVTEVTWEGSIAEALLETSLEKNDLESEINKTRARQRYLDNLTTKNNADNTEDEGCCILCRCDFIRGFITQCAHVFCEGCMKAWLLRKEGKTCPVCRVAVDPDTIERFTMTPDQPEIQKKPILKAEPIPISRRQISYNMIDSTLFTEINSMECFGDYGSKIQTLVRHLLYIKVTEPGAKSIVFSAWSDSLRIIEEALKLNGLRCLQIDRKSKGQSAAKVFKDNPEILVLLLHGERENAGLNITCASRVFLLESVVHHGFEVQAIARIDRMGQTRPTEVYCYYAEDTVERNILDLAARQGLSLYTKENSAGTLNFSSLSAENDAKAVKKKAQKGDFIFKVDDMLAILFPHMYEELEYLIPPPDPAETESFSPEPASEYHNAVAGPSSLRLS